MEKLKTKLDEALLDKEYVDLNLSYTRVSDFDRNGPKALLERTQTDSQALKTGNLIDDLLFISKEEFNKKYHISKFNEPTASLGVLCKIILTNFNEIPNNETILKLIELNSLWSGIKDQDKLIAKYNNSEFKGYLKDKFESIDKVVITKEDHEKGIRIKEIIQTHPFSKDIFNEKYENIYQYPFKVKIKHFYFRGILDIVSIDHKNKKVYFKDFKTGAGPSNEFTSSFIKWRYYLQEAVYTSAFDHICKELGLVNYTLEPFSFIYIGLKEQIPIHYVVTPKWHNSALNGFKTASGYYYKGLYQLIDEIYFHWKNKIYDLPMDVYLNKGKINLDDSFITAQ